MDFSEQPETTAATDDTSHNTGGASTMNFLIRPGSPLHPREIEARAHENWRAAAALVWGRWEALTTASPEDKPGAFAAYTFALEAEAAAAEALADSCLDQAA